MLRTLRNHWKKSIFFTAVGAFLTDYGLKKWKNYQLMITYSHKAKIYGQQLLNSNKPLKKVVVFLNPAASGGTGKKMYEKNVAPLLHLAGLEVTLVPTEYEGQAKKYMEVLDKTDAILVAGGDGTLSEVITGLLRRNDKALMKIPIGIIPLGKTNTLAKSLCSDCDNSTKLIVKLTMSTIEGDTKPVDVINIKGGEDKSVYAANSIELGLLTDSENRKKKNWYFGPLKHRLCYIVSTLFHWPSEGDAMFSYGFQCPGCKNCMPPLQPNVWRWWHIFISPQREVKVDYGSITNEECGNVHTIPLKYSQINFCINQHLKENQYNKRGINVSILPDDISKQEFIKTGWKRINNDSSSSQPDYTISNFRLEFKNQFKEDQWFLIDNEKYEPMDLACTIIPNKLNFYFCKS